MQTLANVLNMPVKVAESDQAPSLGAAIYAAVAVNIYANVIEASKKMGSDFEAEYFPQADYTTVFKDQMESYKLLGEFVENTLKEKKHEFHL